MNEKQAAIVIELTHEFMATMRQIAPKYTKAFFRFSAEAGKHGSNGSYAIDANVALIDPFAHNKFFTSMNEKAMRLLSAMEKKNGIILLAIDSAFNYDINFEYENFARWKISKVNGGTGIPDL